MMKVVRALQVKDAAGVFSRRLDGDTLEVRVILGGGGGGGGGGGSCSGGVGVVDLGGKC